MGRVLWFLLVLFLIPAVHGEIIINEIMYNPDQCSNFYCEWLELYNSGNESVNLTGWTICGKEILGGYINHTDGNELYLNTTLILNASSFALITDGETGTEVYWHFNVSNNSLALHVNTSSICGRLSNSGKTVFLNMSNGTLSHNITYDPSFGGDGNNKTLCGVPDGNETIQECDPTPGSQNNVSSQTSQTGLKIEVCLDGDCSGTAGMAGITYTKLFKITNVGHVAGTTDNINVSVDYNISKNWALFKDSNFSLYDLNSYKTANTGEWTPNETGSFTICGNITYSTANESDISDNFACSNIEIVENPVTLLEYPSKVRFGYYNSTFIRFNTSNYEYNKTKFLIYGNSKRVVADPDWNKITSYAKCQGSEAIEINTDVNNIYYLYIPFFIYPNCDNDYSNGNYGIALRVCSPTNGDFEKYMVQTFSVEISGKNDNLCPTTSTSSCSGRGGGKVTSPSDIEITRASSDEIISYPKKVNIGEEFEIKLKLENKEIRAKNLSVYSYVYEGRKPLSEGFDGNKWKGGWTANKKEVHLAGGSSLMITLKNRIKENVSIGTYNLRVKINEDGKKRNLDKNIEVGKELINEPKAEEKCVIEDEENDNLITGRFIGKDSGDSLVSSLISFLKNLF